MFKCLRKYISKVFSYLKYYTVNKTFEKSNLSRISDLMIPRKDIDAIDINIDYKRLQYMFMETGHKILPVYSGTLDNIRGLIEVNKILDGDKYWKKHIVEITCIPSSTSIQDAVYILTGGKMHLLLVLDEYGGIDGMITTSSLLRRYGPKDYNSIISLGNDKWLVNGRVHLSILNNVMKLHLKHNDIVTIGGYICSLIGRVPKKYEKIQDQSLSFTIQESDEKCIYSVICSKNDQKHLY